MARKAPLKWALLSVAIVSYAAPLSGCTGMENRQVSEAAAASDLSRPNDLPNDGVIEDAGRSPGAPAGLGEPL